MFSTPFVLSFALLLSLPLLFLFGPRFLPPKHVQISLPDELDDLALFRRATLSSSSSLLLHHHHHYHAVSRLGTTNPKPKIAFLFLTNTDLHFAPLWELFFPGHKPLFNIYIHADPSAKLTIPPGSFFENRFIAARKPNAPPQPNAPPPEKSIQDGDAHSDWVSCVRFSPNNLQPTIVSSSWDRTMKIWNLTNCKIRASLAGHSGYVNTVAVSPDGSLCASGGKDGVILLWDLAEGKKLYSLDSGSIINALCFSPNRYWLCAATEASIKIWDLESKTIVVDLKVDAKQEAEMNEGGAAVSSGVKNKVIYCTSLSWSADGSTLFSGYTDGIVRVWGIGR